MENKPNISIGDTTVCLNEIASYSCFIISSENSIRYDKFKIGQGRIKFLFKSKKTITITFDKEEGNVFLNVKENLDKLFKPIDLSKVSETKKEQEYPSKQD